MALLTLTSTSVSGTTSWGAVKGTLLQINPAFNPARHHPRAAALQTTPAHTSAQRHPVIPAPDLSYHPGHLSRRSPNTPAGLSHTSSTSSARQWPTFHDPRRPPGNGHRPPPGQDPIRNTLYCTRVMGEAHRQPHQRHPLLDIGAPDPLFLEKKSPAAPLRRQLDRGQIIFSTIFENVIVNITQAEFEVAAPRAAAPHRLQTRRGDRSHQRELCRRPRKEKRLALFQRPRLPGERHPERQCGRPLRPPGLTEKSQNQYPRAPLLPDIRVYFE